MAAGRPRARRLLKLRAMPRRAQRHFLLPACIIALLAQGNGAEAFLEALRVSSPERRLRAASSPARPAARVAPPALRFPVRKRPARGAALCQGAPVLRSVHPLFQSASALIRRAALCLNAPVLRSVHPLCTQDDSRQRGKGKSQPIQKNGWDFPLPSGAGLGPFARSRGGPMHARRSAARGAQPMTTVVPSGQFSQIHWAFSTARRTQPWEALRPRAFTEELVGPFFLALYSTEWNSTPPTIR